MEKILIALLGPIGVIVIVYQLRRSPIREIGNIAASIIALLALFALIGIGGVAIECWYALPFYGLGIFIAICDNAYP